MVGGCRVTDRWLTRVGVRRRVEVWGRGRGRGRRKGGLGMGEVAR
jgi:hypothetical protein